MGGQGYASGGGAIQNKGGGGGGGRGGACVERERTNMMTASSVAVNVRIFANPFLRKKSKNRNQSKNNLPKNPKTFTSILRKQPRIKLKSIQKLKENHVEKKKKKKKGPTYIFKNRNPRQPLSYIGTSFTLTPPKKGWWELSRRRSRELGKFVCFSTNQTRETIIHLGCQVSSYFRFRYKLCLVAIKIKVQI